MHLKNPLLFSLLAILLLGGTISPVLSQTSPESNSILINEIELNPDNGSEYVELYNPTSEPIDISGWSLTPTATWKKYTIDDNIIIPSQSFLIFTHVNFWLKDFGDTVSLNNISGDLIDQTPLLVDNDDDANTWQRNVDGIDTDSISDWKFKRMTPKTSNGIITETDDYVFTINAETNKQNYIFGEFVTISGTISEMLYSENPPYSPEIIKINVSGPNYFKNLAIFPERNLEFSTELNLQKVLGFKTGDYQIKVTYGQENILTNFSLVDSIDSTSSETIDEILELSTDKNSYIPGETVIFSADATSSIDFGGLDYIVLNPNGKVIFEGTIFPNERFSIVNQFGGGQLFPFSTQLFMSPVNPVYGEYKIEGIFKSQNNRSTSENTLQSSMTFSLVEDVKENVQISLSTDKKIYSVGDTIKVTGRSNDIWVEAMNLDVIQTGVLTKNTDDIKGQHIRPDPFTLKDSIRLNGDGTFSFEFELVESVNNSDDYTHVYGDYRIKVSEHFGERSTYFKVVEDPESFVDIRTPLGFTLDKSEYVLGTAMVISGQITDWEPTGNQSLQYVEVTFLDPNGKSIMSEDNRRTSEERSFSYEANSPNDELRIRANPDAVGGYSMDLILFPIQFDYGTYTAIVTHPSTKLTESIQFEIKSAQDDTVIQGTETEEPLTMKLCKSNRAHVDEIMKDLRSIGRGEIAPSMESVDCSDNLSFYVGDKLVVTGTVIPKSNTSLTQSSTTTSGQTQEGHSYTTDYNRAVMNYVLVSIPYPQSLSIASSIQTVPDADENYTGGGGSGEGGAYYEDKDGNIIRGDVEGRDSSGSTGYDGTVIMKKQKLLLTDMNFKAYPDENGNFAGVFELRAGVFKDGTYLVKADYFGYHIEQVVPIIDKSLKGGLKPNIVINLENEEFTPGDAVRINGLIENIYYYDSVSVKIETPDVSKHKLFTRSPMWIW